MTAADRWSALVNAALSSMEVGSIDGVALVTGGAHRIGYTIAEHLLTAGLKVTLTDVRWRTTRGAIISTNLESLYPGKVTFFVADATSEQMFQRAIESVINRFGRIDLIINAAGVSLRNFDYDLESTVMSNKESINIDGVFRGTKLGLKYMSRAKGGEGGTVVNLSSVSCNNDPRRQFLATSGTRHFVNHLTKCYGNPVHFDSSDVRVLSINPGTSGGGTTLDVQHLGRELLSVLHQAHTGSVWSIINNQPAREIKDVCPLNTELYRSRESFSSIEDLAEECGYVQ